jgi:hypothetical protein
MWPWRRGNAAGSAADPARLPVSRAEWRLLPPIPRTVGEHPLVNPVQRFAGSLSTWQDPSGLAPLGHRVGPDEPAGTVGDLVHPVSGPDLPVVSTPTPPPARPAWTRIRDALATRNTLGVQRIAAHAGSVADDVPPPPADVWPDPPALDHAGSRHRADEAPPTPGARPEPIVRVQRSAPLEPERHELEQPEPVRAELPLAEPAVPEPVAEFAVVEPAEPEVALAAPAVAEPAVDRPVVTEVAVAGPAAAQPVAVERTAGSVDARSAPLAAPVMQRAGPATPLVRRGLGEPIIPTAQRSPSSPAQAPVVDGGITASRATPPGAGNTSSQAAPPSGGAEVPSAVAAPSEHEASPAVVLARLLGDRPQPVAPPAASAPDGAPAMSPVSSDVSVRPLPAPPAPSAAVGVQRVDHDPAGRRSDLDGTAVLGHSPVQLEDGTAGATASLPGGQATGHLADHAAAGRAVAVQRAIAPAPDPVVAASTLALSVAGVSTLGPAAVGVPALSRASVRVPTLSRAADGLPAPGPTAASDTTSGNVPTPGPAAGVPASVDVPTLGRSVASFPAPAHQGTGSPAFAHQATGRLVAVQTAAGHPADGTYIRDSLAAGISTGGAAAGTPTAVGASASGATAIGTSTSGSTAIATSTSGATAGGASTSNAAAVGPLVSGPAVVELGSAATGSSPMVVSRMSVSPTGDLPASSAVVGMPLATRHPVAGNVPAGDEPSPSTVDSLGPERLVVSRAVGDSWPTTTAPAPTPEREPTAVLQRQEAEATPAPPSTVDTASGAPAVGAVDADELLKRLFDPMLRRLKAELRLDRERRGALTDLAH